ncbi:hypothetical protein [Flavobacterium microcysteis]|uniref:DUF4468 domain-containing protein n=1 Tax=Flavobacterium microcysteis TaxID=2596891 RepID=A0A501QLH0_9FLAO|nr:hypothetical protein [Flavobacterium microcysteis]TPD73362.1 hypothetical protein FJA49_01355 [Flavobacterium microcysteis]
MKFCLSILFLFSSIIINAQVRMELTPKGFDPNPIRVSIPFMTNEKFINGTQLWIQEFSRGEADVSEVTQNSLTIDAFRDNAFFYRNLGDTFYQKVKYRMKISKEGNEYVLSFQVTEIYAKKTLLKSGITDYFTPDGKMKDGFQDVKPSIEKTVGIILDSYYRYITNYAKS